MKKISLIFGIITLGLWCAAVWAQTKPKLVDIFFYVDGKRVNQAGGGDVTVELKFDKAMKMTVEPKVNYGLLGESYPLNLPVRGQWQDGQLGKAHLQLPIMRRRQMMASTSSKFLMRWIPPTMCRWTLLTA